MENFETVQPSSQNPVGREELGKKDAARLPPVLNPQVLVCL
jgi:hypothetical protein